MFHGSLLARWPWVRKIGVNTPYWYQRTASSRNSSSCSAGVTKPPISAAPQGIPAIARFSPAIRYSRRWANEEAMSCAAGEAP